MSSVFHNISSQGKNSWCYVMKIKKSGELLWLFGLIFVGLGVAICNKADLGVSMIAAPAFVIYEAISGLSEVFSVGMAEYLIQGLLLIVLSLVIRRFKPRFLFAFLTAVIYGYVLNFFIWLLDGITITEIWLRWVLLLVGDIITALGVASFFRTYMPLQVYELFVGEISNIFKLNIIRVKWFFDIALLIVSIILAFSLFDDAETFDFTSIYYKSFHSIGLGTIVTTIINSPIIKFMGKLIDNFFDNEPLFPKLKSKLSEA